MRLIPTGASRSLLKTKQQRPEDFSSIIDRSHRSRELNMDQDIEDQGEQDDDRDWEQVMRARWRSLFSFTTKRHGVPLLFAIIFSIASGIVIPALALFLGGVFDSFTNFGAGMLSASELVKKVSWDGLALVGLGSASWLLNGGYFMLWLAFGELQAKSVRDKLFDGMLVKDMEWYDMRKNGIGALLPRFQTQIRELQIATSQPLGFVVQYVVTALAALGLAFYTSWNLTLVTLATVPVTAVVLSYISAKMQPSIKAQQEKLTQASKLVNNAITSIDTVKCFNGQDWEVWQYAKSVREAAKYYLRQAQANALQIGFIRVATLGMFVQGFWYGSTLVQSGQRSAGQILTAFWACLLATQAIEQILPQMIVLEKGRAAGATLKATLVQIERGRRVVKMIGRKTPRYCDGDIEVRNVSFAYPVRPDQDVLNSATFFFPAGETTFVIGKSGSGKSTLGNLLMQFYAPRSGDISIDGNSLSTLDINWLRNNITLVQQQSVLFNETIFKNIAFGRKDHGRVRKKEVEKSIEIALLQHTIMDMPDGLDTLVGSGGNSMSGGQRQRVAIARARLRDTPILILDEATSALDPMTRSLVMDAIREWRTGRTTIIITHDISQILKDDYVYVLSKGVIVQEGYRYALESSDGGPFKSFLPRKLDTLTSQPEPKELPISKTLSVDSPRSSLRSSVISQDSMDFSFEPRLRFIPSVFGAAEEGTRRPSLGTQRRGSFGLISPLSPMIYSGGLTSHGRSSILSVSRRTGPIRTLEPALLSPTREMEMVELTGRTAALKRSNTTRQVHTVPNSSPPAPTRATRQERIKAIFPRRKRQLTKAEKDRRILPISKILATVWPTLPWPKRICLVFGFICAFIHAAATPTFSWVFSKLLATFFVPDGRSEALAWSLSVLGVAVGDALASYLMHYLLEICGQAWVDTLRIEALKRILDQSRSWFDRDKNSISRLTECLDRNAEEMRNLLGRFAAFVFVAVTMMVMAVIWSMALSWKLTLVGLASAPLLYGLTRGFEAVSGKWEGKSNDAGEAASSIFTETFINIRTVRALTLEGYFHKKYAKATDKAIKVGLRRSALSGLFFGLSDSGIIFVTALIFYYGAILASTRQNSTQDILTVFTMLLFSIANANAIIAFVPQINSSRDTATRLLRLSSLPYHKSHESTGQLRISHVARIDFRDLSFTYPSRPDTTILQKLHLTIPPNTCTAIVGSSGSGKSTVASLILGLYPPSTPDMLTPSTLLIEGRDIRTLHIPTLRSLVAVVAQQPTLFATSIAANITYGLPEGSPLNAISSIRAAAQAAGIDEFIDSLPKGYHTRVGDGGFGLSGGQAQRLAIARALVRKPEVLILDEATSALDAESAEVVRESVRSLVTSVRGMTVIIITHSQEMMEMAEHIIVLQKGRVAEQGPFAELVKRGGEFRKLLSGGEWLGLVEEE